MSAFLSVTYETYPKRVGALAYGLKAFVSAHDGIPPEVFVFHRDTRMLATGYPFDWKSGAEFQNVATPVDIEEVPAAGCAGDTCKFFRTDSVELVFRSPRDVIEAKNAIDADLNELVKSWSELGDGERASETRVYGTSPEWYGNEDDGESASASDQERDSNGQLDSSDNT